MARRASAYRLATSQNEEIKTIRDNIILIINPISEPDGWDKQVDWYYRYSKNKKEFADGSPSVPYWGKYTYHDNNRDSLQMSQAITKGLLKIYYDWHPVVSLDLHESVPLLYISTGTGPYNETIDPITIGEWQTMAHHDITSLAAQGLPGVFTWAFYDGWYPGYGLWVSNNHNSAGRFYETFGNAGANTYLRDLAEQKYAGDPATSKEWYRPVPPTEKVYWSYRNGINYMEAGVLASMSYEATNGRLLMKNFYQKGVNNIRKGTDMTGGSGFDGINNLKSFLEAGGVLVTLDNSSMLVAEAGITRALRTNTTATAAGLFHPGSIVMAKSRSNSPVLYGFPDTFPIFKGMGPLLQTAKYNRSMLLLQYGTKPLKDEEEYKGLVMGMPDKKVVKDRDVGPSENKTPKKEDPYLVSGMVRNEQAIIGHGAVFNVPVGAGRVIAFTFDPLHRFLNHHDAPMVWNVLMNWNNLAETTPVVSAKDGQKVGNGGN